jgi:tetratricopeptide (TPR) repeat protein
VYTLGVILYDLLADRPPYRLDGLPLPDAVRVIREREPPRLGTLDPRLWGDVETITARALEKDRARRYPSAAELAADIRRHLAHEPIRARPPSVLYHLGKFTRRHKALVATTAAFLALLLGSGAVTAWQEVRLARAERDRAVEQARRTQDVQDALARVAVLRERARAAAGDPGEWAEARAMARRAEALVEDGPVAPGLAERVAGLLHELDEEHADRRLIARLANVRLLVVEVNAADNRFAGGKALPEYRAAFAESGLRPASTDPAAAAALLLRRPAEVRGPVVAGLESWLTLAHHEKAAEAGWLERVLAVVDPDDWRQRLRAATAARDLPAVEALAREADVAAQPPGALEGLAQVLQANGKVEGAVGLMRRAREVHPGNFWINHTLGLALAATKPPQPDEAIRFLTVAVALQPGCAGAWYNLAVTLLQYDRLDEAIAACRKAVGLKPAYAMAHFCLGVAFERKGPLEEAIAAYRKAVALGAGSAPNHTRLGMLLGVSGDTPGAAAEFRAALAVDPDYFPANFSLGKTLLDLGDNPGAAACYRRVIRIDPKHAATHCNLGHALLRLGDLRGALTSYRTGHDLGTRQKDWRYPSAEWVKRCERLLELEDRLPPALRGEGPSAGRLDLAELCRYKGLHAAAARFYSEAFDAGANPADDPGAGHRFWAACSAARAGCGEGGDAATVRDEARAGLRGQALAWLRADLAELARRAAGGAPQDRAGVRAALHNWQGSPALACVRDAGRVVTLPPAERAAWQQLWAEVSATLPKALGTN